MSKDSFKVKNGLTLTPIDPSEIVNPQAGDLIADSTDDNKIKRYDATSADWSSVGGSAGIGGNLMAEFEKLTPDLVNVTSAVDTVTFLPIDDNNKSIKATWSGSVGSIQFQVPVDSSLHEIQGTVSVWIRTSLDNIQVSSVQDDVKLSTLPVSGTGKWKQYELPVVVGGAEMGFIVESTTGVTGDVYIDQPFVGLTPSSYGFEVAQSEYVGSLTYAGASNCTWSVNSTSFSNFPIDSDCSTPTSTGELQYSGTKIPGFKLTNVKAGTYRIVAKALFYVNSGSFAVFRFTDGTNTFGYGEAQDINDNRSTDSIEGTITYNAPQNDVTFQIQARVTGQASVNANDPVRPLHFDVYYYPPKTTIVTQTQEETVETANEFSFKVNTIDGVVISQNLDWINNCTTAGTGTLNCTFNTGIFNDAPSCSAVVENASNDYNVMINNLTASGFSIRTAQNVSTSNTTLSPAQVGVICQKQGADYNKSRLIVGQFEQIKSTELCEVRAFGNDGEIISGAYAEDIPWKNIIVDNCGIFDNSGNTGQNTNDAITPIRSGLYQISLSIRLTAAANFQVDIHKNGVLYQSMGTVANSGLSTVNKFNSTVYLEEGQVYTFVIASGGSFTLQTIEQDLYHLLTITELPDTAAIVKNLNDRKTVKCQTKILTSDVTAAGEVAELTFSGLTIGKRYQYTINYVTASGTVVDVYNIDGGPTYAIQYIENNTGSNLSSSGGVIFKAAADNIKHIKAGAGGRLYSSTSLNRTNVTLCELPDYYIDTDEW